MLAGYPRLIDTFNLLVRNQNLVYAGVITVITDS
jgi:hypothetical protein